jgi:hypothetical protein
MLYHYCFSTSHQIKPSGRSKKLDRFGNEWTQQLLVYAENVNSLDENINIAKKNAKHY